MKLLLEKIFIQPKIIILIFSATAFIVFASALLEYYQSKNEIYDLMDKQSHTLLESILTSSKSAITSYNKIENDLKQRLFNNANLIRLLYEKGGLTEKSLSKIALENEIFRINIFNNQGIKILSSNNFSKMDSAFSEKSKLILSEIFNNEADSLVIGFRASRLDNNYRYVVAVATRNNGAVVLNVDAEELLKIRNELGFGPLLKQVAKNENIKYVAFQNENGIIAAAGNVSELEELDSSAFLMNSYKNKVFLSRILKLEESDVFEAVHPLILNNSKIGLIRLGLSTDAIHHTNARILNRTIIMSILFFVIGIIIFSMLFAKQNYDVLFKKFKSMEGEFQKIFENVNDGIILLNDKNDIQTINSALLNIFSVSSQSEFEINYNILLSEILASPSLLIEKEIEINSKLNSIVISKNIFYDDDNSTKTIIVIRDITKQKLLENKITRNERLVALGQLSSSVAHEIRNPLNAIGTITQQLGKDFSVVNNANEFNELTSLIHKEVKRINQTIINFLKFAKPEPIKVEKFNLAEFWQQLIKQYTPLLNEKNAKLSIIEKWTGEVTWDKAQLKQVFINLIENSLDAINKEGIVKIEIEQFENSYLQIIFSDNGEGIPEDKVEKIFNLYFTTKPKGSGIGLSIIQKIISEHNGTIQVTSRINIGTSFQIIIPIACEEQ